VAGGGAFRDEPATDRNRAGVRFRGRPSDASRRTKRVHAGSLATCGRFRFLGDDRHSIRDSRPLTLIIVQGLLSKSAKRSASLSTVRDQIRGDRAQRKFKDLLMSPGNDPSFVFSGAMQRRTQGSRVRRIVEHEGSDVGKTASAEQTAEHFSKMNTSTSSANSALLAGLLRLRLLGHDRRPFEAMPPEGGQAKTVRRARKRHFQRPQHHTFHWPVPGDPVLAGVGILRTMSIGCGSGREG